MQKILSIILTVALLTSVLTVNVAMAETSTAMLEIYVSPTGNDNNDGMSENAALATLSKAQEIVEDNNGNMTGDIVVHILPGYYQLEEKLVFGPNSGGTNGYDVVYQGEGTDANPAIVGGGTLITGWTDNNGDGVWKAPANIENTRTLYVNGYPAQRAKSKYLYKVESGVAENYIKTSLDSSDPEYEYVQYNYSQLSHGFKIPANNILYNYQHPEEIELVWPLEWTHQRTPVENIFLDEDTNYVVFDMKDPYWMWANKKEMQDTNPISLGKINWTTPGTPVDGDKVGSTTHFYIENALELLDEPGEFYFDKTNQEIYYKPYDGEDLETSETYVGTTEFMVNIEGTSENKVENIVFDNLEFRYGAWNEVTNTGISVTQGDHIINKRNNLVKKGGRSMPAQFTVNFAKDIDITDCKFICLGSSAIKMEDGVSDSLIQGNIIRDISGTGIMIDSYEHEEDDNGNLAEGQERCDNISVLNNVIHRAANEFKSMMGISMYFPSNTTIAHNDIKRVPYSAITAGWGWGNYNSTGATGNEIANNKIEDVMNIAVDGGHIYTLDTIPGLKIKDNYLVKSTDWRGGIYLDSGSEGYIIENNVVENSTQWFFARPLDGNTQLNNIVATNNYYDEFSTATIDSRDSDGDGVKNVEASNNTRVERTNNSIDEALQWPAAASSIIANAGLEAGFASLLNDVDLPQYFSMDSMDREPKAGFKDWDSLWISAVDFSKYSDTDIIRNPAGVHESKYVPLANVNNGDWVEYKVTVEKELPYNLQIYAKISNNDGVAVNRNINVSVDGGEYVTKTLTGTYYDTYDLGSVGTLSEGEHTVRIQFPDSYDCVLAKLRLYNASYFSGVQYDDGTSIQPETEEPEPVEDVVSGLYESSTIMQTGTITCSDFNTGTGVGADTSGASGTAIIMEVGESAEWTINADAAAMCDIRLFGNGWERKTVQSSGGTQTTGEDKAKPYAKLTVNGVELGQVYINNSDGASAGTGTIKETVLPSFAVNEGENTIRLEATGNVNLWKNMTYKLSYGGKLECETYIDGLSSIYKDHAPEGRLTMVKDNYAEYILSPGRAGRYQLVLVGNSSESNNPTQVTLEVNGAEAATATLNRDGAHNDCITYPSATVLAEVDLEATSNSIKLTETACTSGWDYIGYQLCSAGDYGTIEAESYKATNSGSNMVHADGKRIVIGNDRYADFTFPGTASGLYRLKLVANSYTENPQIKLSVIKNYGDENETIIDIGTVDLNNDGVHNDCLTYPLETVLPVAELEAGDTIRLTTAGSQSCWDRIDYISLDEVGAITDASYVAVADLGGYESGTLVVDIYEDGALVSSIYSDVVRADGKIVIDNISVLAGQTVEVSVCDDTDGDTVSLTDVKIYN